MTLTATRLMRAPLFFSVALLAACSTTKPPLSVAGTNGSKHYCIGRLAVTAETPLQFLESSAQFYWGDIDTYREDAASYAQRLLAAQASASDGRVRQLVKPVETLAQDDGRVIVTREEEALPLDPNVVQVTGFAHRDGTTFRFQKRAISRLQDITERRTKEILASITSSASSFPPAAQSQQGFCVMHGIVNLAPGHDWHEASRVEGEFTLQKKRYRFSLRSRYLRSLSLNDQEVTNQRDLLLALAGAIPDSRLVSISELPVAASTPSQGSANLLEMTTADGKQQVYEWHMPAASTAPSTPATSLYIWPASGQASAQDQDNFMRWIAAHPQQATPLLQIRHMASGGGQHQATPAAEESRLVYRMQLHYPGNQSAGGRHYVIYKDGQKVDEGFSDAHGFTKAHNADYDQIWGTTVLNK
ncbi:hypothetical protein [Xanthomonas campestris]|uniref:Lipoprotein n=1 Tax=Xanthomonas campestris pv. papavericola TaxID=487881 RepID=A0AAJ2X1Y5_XANCA|nr:hypothetical protein [Xanthomonas campestris]MEC3887406.1 hypothetical protein [Xanthomonas campestris pv. papavericola]